MRRERFEIIFDILKVIQDHNNKIKSTPLLYSSNLSPKMHKNYIAELKEKTLIEEKIEKGKKYFSLTNQGFAFLEKFHSFKRFVEGIGL